MSTNQVAPKIPLPKGWKQHVRSAVLHVISADRLLTVKPAEAKFYGLAQTTIANDQQLKAYFGASSIRRYHRSWSESMVRYLTNPVVMGILIGVHLWRIRRV